MFLFLSYFGLHFLLSLLICGLGVFFIFLSGGQFEDVSSWLYLSRNFLYLLVKGASAFIIYKSLSFYWSNKYAYKKNFSIEKSYQVGIFFTLFFFVRGLGNEWDFWDLNDTSFFIYFVIDYTVFYLLRMKIREFSRSDLFVVSFLYSVSYLLIYQEKLEFGPVMVLIFLFFMSFLNKWNDFKNVLLAAVVSTTTFNFYSKEINIVVPTYIACFLATAIWSRVRKGLPNKFTRV